MVSGFIPTFADSPLPANPLEEQASENSSETLPQLQFEGDEMKGPAISKFYADYLNNCFKKPD